MKVNQEFLSICDKCRYLQLTVCANDLYANNSIYEREIVLTCEKLNECKRAMQKAVER